MATEPRPKASTQILDRVRAHAFATLTPQTAADRHLGVVPRMLRKGETLKLVDRRIKVPDDSVLVFEDQMPGANFGHPCRYLFHSSKDGSLLQTVEAMFPPEVADIELLPQYFHEPLAQLEPRPNIYAKFDWTKVSRYPWLVDDNRFALLWTSQISNRRHVEDTEFAYRILRHKFGFRASNIYVLCYNGTIDSTDFHGANMATWVGDGTAYQMQINASATKANLQSTLTTISNRMNADSLLFVHTNNHGSHVRPVRGQLLGRHARRVVDDARRHEGVRNPGGDDGAVLLGRVPAADAQPQQGRPHLVRERGARRQGQRRRLALRPVGPRLVRGRQRGDCVRREPGAQPRRQFERKGQRHGRPSTTRMPTSTSTPTTTRSTETLRSAAGRRST